MQIGMQLRCVRLEALLSRMPSMYHKNDKSRWILMHSNRSCDTLMSFIDHSAQRHFKSNTPNKTA